MDSEKKVMMTLDQRVERICWRLLIEAMVNLEKGRPPTQKPERP